MNSAKELVSNKSTWFGLKQPPYPTCRKGISPHIEAYKRSAHQGGHFPRESRTATTAQTPAQLGEGRLRRKSERPSARVEQNLWQEVMRKCWLPLAPPTGGHPKHRGFDNVPGAEGGGLPAPGRPERTRSLQLLQTRTLTSGTRPRGPKPTAPIRKPGEKGAVEQLVGLRRVQPARSEAQSPELPPPPPSEPPGPGRRPPLISPRALPSAP